MMTTILITGSRSWKDKEKIKEQLKSCKKHDLIIHGGAIGADTLAHQVCDELELNTKVYRPLNPSNPNYYLHRNTEMIGACDIVYAFWDGKSRGTKFTIDYSVKRGKFVKVFYEDKDEVEIYSI